MHLINFEENNSLGGRINGLKIRQEIVANINNTVEINLKNVEVISNSFADEAFGKLLTEEKMSFAFLRENLKFNNSSDLVRSLIVKALNERRKEIE